MSTEVGVASMRGISPGPNAKRNVCGESYKANNLNSIIAIESPKWEWIIWGSIHSASLSTVKLERLV